MQSLGKIGLKTQVYDQLKLWDKKRALILKSHQKAIERILESIDIKMQDSKDFSFSLETVLEERVNQIKAYAHNSLVDSELVFDKNKHESYTNHYELLRTAFALQAENCKLVTQKLQNLKQVLSELKGSNEDKQKSADKNDDSSVMLTRSNIKYMLEYELPEIVQKMTKGGEKTSKAFNQKKQEDLFIAIQQFTRLTEIQTHKHRDIGRQLLNFVSSAMKKEVAMQIKIRNCLFKWSKIDGPIQPIFLEQLSKKQPQFFVKDFYDLEDMASISYGQSNVQDFLINFKIEQFKFHDKLKLCSMDGFYNSKISAQIIITVDGYLHLCRSNMVQPDFSLRLNNQLVITKVKECTLWICQMRKKFYLKKEKQFQFSLELNNQQDLHILKNAIERIIDFKI